MNDGNETGLGKVVLVIIAILLPPLAVALVDGLTGPFWLSIVLTLLFYLPGLIYALFRIFR
ncbi:MAG: YqaE/Pmp3 family membrane protein [Cytophagaceae bacterium]|nr:YqaE/Pmp3 family membrane protein [Cytophagaceae bacterium]